MSYFTKIIKQCFKATIFLGSSIKNLPLQVTNYSTKELMGKDWRMVGSDFYSALKKLEDINGKK